MTTHKIENKTPNTIPTAAIIDCWDDEAEHAGEMELVVKLSGIKHATCRTKMLMMGMKSG
jgi:hypothetical protein